MTEFVDYSDRKAWSMAEAREVAATIPARAAERAAAFAAATRALPDPWMHVTGPPGLAQWEAALRAAVEMRRRAGPHVVPDLDQSFSPMDGPFGSDSPHTWTDEAFAFWQGEMFRLEIEQLDYRMSPTRNRRSSAYRLPYYLRDEAGTVALNISGYRWAALQIIEGVPPFSLEWTLDSRRRWLMQMRERCAAPPAPQGPVTLDELVPIVLARATGCTLFLDDYYRSLFEGNVDVASIAVARSVDGVTRARMNDSDHLVVTGTAAPRDVQAALARHAIADGDLTVDDVDLDG